MLIDHGDGCENIVAKISETYTGEFCSSSKVLGTYLYITDGEGHCVLLLIMPITIQKIPKKINVKIIVSGNFPVFANMEATNKNPKNTDNSVIIFIIMLLQQYIITLH